MPSDTLRRSESRRKKWLLKPLRPLERGVRSSIMKSARSGSVARLTRPPKGTAPASRARLALRSAHGAAAPGRCLHHL